MESIIYNAKGPLIEAIAGVALSPGEWVEWSSTNKNEVILDVASDGCAKMIVIEDSLQGRTIYDSYTSGEVIQLLCPLNGDIVYSNAEAALSAAAPVEIDSGVLANADPSELLRWRIMGVTLEDSSTSAPYWTKVQICGR